MEKPIKCECLCSGASTDGYKRSAGAACVLPGELSPVGGETPASQEVSEAAGYLRHALTRQRAASRRGTGGPSTSRGLIIAGADTHVRCGRAGKFKGVRGDSAPTHGTTEGEDGV